jgi:LmbE family N-acetylglucosaminyl deacetylase
MQVAVLSPHRDDAAFSCGLILSKLIEAEVSVTIVNVFTTSSYAPYLTIGESDRVSQVTLARANEDDTFVDLLYRKAGVAQRCMTLVDLGWEDLPLRWHAKDDQSLAPSMLRPDEVSALSDALRGLAEQYIVLAPLALGGHIDHRLVRAAAQRAFHSSSLVFYEDLPYACRMTAAECQAARVSDSLLREVWLPNDRTEAGLKRASALCYPSQIAPDVADEVERYAENHDGRERFVASPEAIRKLEAIA